MMPDNPLRDLENPVAQGNYDDTWKDSPDMTVKCPHCGAIWERQTVAIPFNSRLYDWNTTDIKHAYSTHDRNHKPTHQNYCYACVPDCATAGEFRAFVEECYKDEFREWMVGL